MYILKALTCIVVWYYVHIINYFTSQFLFYNREFVKKNVAIINMRNLDSCIYIKLIKEIQRRLYLFMPWGAGFCCSNWYNEGCGDCEQTQWDTLSHWDVLYKHSCLVLAVLCCGGTCPCLRTVSPREHWALAATGSTLRVVCAAVSRQLPSANTKFADGQRIELIMSCDPRICIFK